MIASHLCRHLFLLLLFWSACSVAFAQNDPFQRYQAAWDSINTLNSEGKTRTALTVAQNLYQTMDKNSNDPKTIAANIKTLLLVQQNQARLEEDGFVKVSSDL